MKRKWKKYFFLFFFFLFISSSFPGSKKIDYRKARYKNVCKDLKGDVLVYLIFVDTKQTATWTEFDIQSTLDSLAKAVKWLQQEARTNHISLNLITDFFIGNEHLTIRKNLPFESVKATVTNNPLKKGLALLNDWADNIARRAGLEMNIIQKEGLEELKHPRNTERLIAYLRELNKVESVALLFMLNNYYKYDISLPVNHFITDDVEFAIVSYKYPSIIAHNILHLFGAADLCKTVYRTDPKKIQQLKELFPNDIMQDVYAKNIFSLSIGDITKYLIGWTNHIDKQYIPFLTDKIK